jgi:hypothetical protein
MKTKTVVFLLVNLLTAIAFTGIGMAQAQSSAVAAPATISTVYTGDVINGKKVVSSLNTSDLAPWQEAPPVLPGCADVHRAVLVRVGDRRQGGQAR